VSTLKKRDIKAGLKQVIASKRAENAVGKVSRSSTAVVSKPELVVIGKAILNKTKTA